MSHASIERYFVRSDELGLALALSLRLRCYGVLAALPTNHLQHHEELKTLFQEFAEAEGKEKGEIAKTAIQDLEVHAELEEKLIYPAIRAEIDEDDMMNEAVEEHHLVHVLIAELKKLKPSHDKFQAKFTVLGELVKHHVEEEEGEMLPQAEKTNIDWDELETRVMKRREQLMTKTSATSKNGGRSASAKK